MDLDGEMELLMAGKVVDPERKKMFTYEVGDDDRGTYVIRLDGEFLLLTMFMLYGMFLGSMLAKRG